MNIIRKFIELNREVSRQLERLLPEKYTLDGNQHFRRVIAPSQIKSNTTVYDLGGGKIPFLSPEEKKRLQIRVIGVDIDEAELKNAPEGSYDEILVCDVSKPMDVKGDADLIICQSVFEHIPDTQRAVQNLAAMLKPGGKAIIFCPSKYAVFAIINLILPEQLKVSLLSRIYPETLVGYGFKAHYHKCTIGEISQSAKEAGLTVETAIPYYRSSYFHFFLPLHLIWRVWNLFFAIVAKERAAETMTLILSKPNKRSRQ